MSTGAAGRRDGTHVPSHSEGAGDVGLGERANTRHVLWTILAAHIVAMVHLLHGVKDNLLSTTHLH